MNKQVICYLFIFASLWCSKAHATGVSAIDTTTITLQEVISRARLQSVDAAVAINKMRTAYWVYRTYKADLLPEMSFDGTLPSYQKRYNAYQQDSGNYTYVRSNLLGINSALSITQNIWFSGGTLSLKSSLDYMKQMGTDGQENYMSVPISLTLTQPIFGVNHVKWQRKIEPVKYREAKAQFISDTEEVATSAVQHFFSLLLSQENVHIAQQNLRNAKKLYDVAMARKRIGQISTNDLLQLKLNTINATSHLTSMQSEHKSALFKLRSFLDISDDTELLPELPKETLRLQLSFSEVLNRAKTTNAFAENIRKRQLEADYAVAQAKGNMRNINLFASVGYTGHTQDFDRAYSGLKDNQIIEVGVSIPLLDWGKRRGKVRVAKGNQKLVASQLKQEKQEFEQNVFLLVEQFNNQSEQLYLASQADSIAQQRYKTSVETFLAGKINTLDLNDAQSSKDAARQKHISELYKYWYYYYEIRSLTLWDYHHNCEISVALDFEK